MLAKYYKGLYHNGICTFSSRKSKNKKYQLNV